MRLDEDFSLFVSIFKRDVSRISQQWALLREVADGKMDEIIHAYAREFFKYWISEIHWEGVAYDSKERVRGINIGFLKDGEHLFCNVSTAAKLSLVEVIVRRWIERNRDAMSHYFPLSEKIISFIKNFFRPLDEITFSLVTNYDKNFFMPDRVKISAFFKEIYGFTFGHESNEFCEFLKYNNHPGCFGNSLNRIIIRCCRQTWSLYGENCFYLAELIMNYEGRECLSGLRYPTYRPEDMSFHEFIISILSYCSSDAFYRKHFCQFNFDKSNDYTMAQRIIRLLDNNNLTASDLGFSSTRYGRKSTLNDRLRYFMNKIKCVTIKSVLERYIYSPDVQKKARKEMDYSIRVEFASKELGKIAEQAPKCAAQSSEDGMTSLLDGKTVSCFSEPAEPVESFEDRMKFLIVERCVSETLQDKFCLDDSSKHDANVLDRLKKLTHEVHHVHYEVRFKYDHAEFDFKIFMKYLNLFIVNSYLKDECLLKNAFEVLDNVSDKENINQITEYLHKEWVLLGGLNVCDFHPSSAIVTNCVSSDDELLEDAKELFSPCVSPRHQLLVSHENLCQRVEEFRDLYQNILIENIKKKFFAYISLLSYESLQGSSEKIFEEFPYYLMIDGDRDVRHMAIILKKLSKYSHDGRWISLASFMEKIKSDFEFFFDMMDEAYLQDAFDSVMVLHWRRKIGAEEAMEAKYVVGIVSILQQPSWNPDDLTQLEVSHLHFQSELALQKRMFSSSPNLFKAHDGFFIDAADRCIEEMAIVISFLKKLYNAGSPRSEACIADFDSCIASLRIADEVAPISVNKKRRKRGVSKRNPVAVSLGCDNNPSSDDQYPAAIIAQSSGSSKIYLGREDLIKQSSLARKERCIHGIMQLKQECEKDVQMILSEAIADHRGCARHDSLGAFVEKILNKRRTDTFTFFSRRSLVNCAPKWPAAKIAYIRSLILNDDFNIANNIVLFLKQSSTSVSYIKDAQQVLSELSTVSHPALKTYCTQLMNERVDQAYTDWITDIASLNSKNDLPKSYMFLRPYAVYLSQTKRYKAEWDDLMSKVWQLMTESDPKKYEEFLRTQYSTDWSKSPHRSERALHLLWQRLRCEAHVTDSNLQRLVRGFESLLTAANPVHHNRIVAILRIIQKQPLEQFFYEFKGELIGGSREAQCQLLANGLKDDAVLKKTMDKFIATVFKDPHFCEKLTAPSIGPTFKAFTFLQLSHAAKQYLTGRAPATFFAASGLTEFLIKRASSNKVVPLEPTASVPAITYVPAVAVSAPVLSSKQEETPVVDCEPLPLKIVVAHQITAAEVLKIKVFEIYKKILKVTYEEDPAKQYAKQFFLFCMPVTVKGSLPKTLQKLKNYIEQHPLIACDGIEALQEHVRALEKIISDRRPEYGFCLDPRFRAGETEDFYKAILVMSGALIQDTVRPEIGLVH